MTEPLQSPFARPLYMMAKPAGSVCNLRCSYCYYLEKGLMYPRGDFSMTPQVLERFIKQYIEAQTMPCVMFTWHGGEPLLRPLSFYEQVIKLQQKHSGGKHIDNCIQTNGTMLTDEYCRFFSRHDWLVGISIDGHADVHDTYRRSARGTSTHQRVMDAIAMLDRHGVRWNAMAVVNNLNANDPVGFYNFFKSIGCKYIQFAPIVERISRSADGRWLSAASETGDIAPWSVTPGQWGRFLCGLFDEWIKQDVGSTFIQIFDAVLAGWAGVDPGLCTLGASCGHAGIIEHNGDVYSCDHFVFPEYRLGNIAAETILGMMTSEAQHRFGAMKRGTLPRQCRECRFTNICNGECPKNRFTTTADGEPGLNYLCEGYRTFYEHSAPAMAAMRDLIREHRAPAEVMDIISR